LTEIKDEIQKTLDIFAEKHGFGKLSAEFYSKTQEETEPQNVIIREGAEQHELFRDNLFNISNGGKITAEHFSAYLAKLETSIAASVVGHNDLILYDVDVVKLRRDYQVRERQNKLGRDLDLPVPDAKNCSVGDTVLIYDPGTRCSSYMKIARIEKKSVVLHDIANSFGTIKISLERFKSEQGFNLTEAKVIDTPAEQTPLSSEHRLYDKISRLLPDFINGKYSRLCLEAKERMPLSLEWTAANQFAMAHTKTENGAVMLEPEIIFRIDHNAKTLVTRAFNQSVPPIDKFVTNANGDGSVYYEKSPKDVVNIREKMNKYSAKWLDNIEKQGCTPVRATLRGAG
jgi:hypothetical protein